MTTGTTSEELTAYGLSVTPPTGWSVSISQDDAGAPEGTTALPVVHASTLPLPDEVGTFGGGLVQYLGPNDSFVAIVEFVPSDDATLFNRKWETPWSLSEADFAFNVLQRTIPGQAGCQQFFTTTGRAFSLYAVVGNQDSLDQVMPDLNSFLASVRVEPTAN